MDKHGILTDNFIRKLTPIECERLQTVPDNYTKIASDNQRYRMLCSRCGILAVNFNRRKGFCSLMTQHCLLKLMLLQQILQ